MRHLSRSIALIAFVLAVPAFAQKVVVLEIDGDSTHRLRAQIENALKNAGTVEVLSLQSYKDAAMRKKLKGGAAFTPAGVARTSKALRLDAAVSGEIDGNTYKVLIWDRTGQQLWTKELPLKRGLLSEDFAGKLARAITAAAEQGATKADPNAGSGGDDGGEGIDLSQGSTDTDVSTPPPRRKKQPEPPPEDPNRDSDLDAQTSQVAHVVPGPPLIRGSLMGTTTWRSQCLRPGVQSCKEYDLSSTKPQGIVIDFTAPTPFLGLALSAEVYPLHAFNKEGWQRFINGIGLLANFNMGWSVIRLIEETPQGQGAPTTIASTDVGYSAQLVWRIHFAMGYGKPEPVGFIGIRAGLASRSFNIDPTAATSLPSSVRTAPTGIGFPAIGLDVAIPVAPFLRIEAGASVYLNPRPSSEQIIGYGNLNDPTGGATASGFGFEAGLTGEIWGPIGYVLKLRYMSFSDHYFGQGQKWTVCNDTQCGGVGEEVYTQILWGLTAKY